MYSWILLGIAILTVVFCSGFAAMFGLPKAKARLIVTAACAALALGISLLVKRILPSPEVMMSLVRNNLGFIGKRFGSNAVKTIELAFEYAEISPTLGELVTQLSAALILPLLCVLFFAVSFALVWLVFLIVFRIVRKRNGDLEDDEDERSTSGDGSRLAAAGLGLVQGLIVLAIVLIPISCYTSIAEPTINELLEQDLLSNNSKTVVRIHNAVTELNDSSTLTVYRKIGGNALSNAVMSMRVANTNVKVSEELSSMVTLVQRVLALKNTSFTDYGVEQAEIIRSIGDSFAESKLLSPIVGDILYAATEAWLHDEAFLGMERPSLGEEATLLDPMVTALLEIFNEDARNTLMLQADVKTTADLVAVLAQNGVLSNMKDTSALLSSLNGGAINSMVTSLGTNESMKRLIPEIMNLGVRAVGQVLSIPVDTTAVYNNYMTTVAEQLNVVRDLPEQERIQALSTELSSAFDTAGMDIDEQVIDFYAAAMLHDLVDGNASAVTEADVQAFFVLYAQGAVQTSSSLRHRPNFDLLTSTQSADPLAGTVYEKMSEEQRQNSAAVAVATLCVKLSVLDEATDNITEQAAILVSETFTDLLGKDSVALEVVINVQITQPVSAKTNECAASLQSTEEMKKTSTVITLETILVDAKEAASKITADTIALDAKAISSIFDTAASLTDLLSGGELNLADIASSVGTILDSLAETDTFGKDKTASLFTSVLQSETVRDKANLDMKTATQLAQKATEGDVNYTQTMNTVATSVNIMETLAADGTISEDELVDLIRNLNAQTAGMIEIYVTPARLVENKIPEKYSEVSSDLIKSLFGYIADSDKSHSEVEAKAVNQILTITLAAKESDDTKLFSSAPGAEDGKLPTATETVNTLLDSMAVRHALVDVLTDGSTVTVFDPYELSGKIKQGSQDYTDFISAVDAYGAAHPEVDELTLNALMALFGVAP